MTATEEQNNAELKAIDALNQSSWEIARTDPDTGYKIAQRAEAEAKVIDYAHGVAHALKNQGACLNWLSQYEEALKKLFTALDKFKELDDKKAQIETIASISIAFYYLGDYHNDLRYSMQSYKLALEINDFEAQADALNGRGTIYYTLGKNNEAVSTLTKALRIAEKTGNQEIMAKIHDGLGESYNNLGQYDKAQEHLEKCLSLSEELNISQIRSYALFGIGSVYLNQSKIDDAYMKFNESFSIRKEMGFVEGQAKCLIKMAECRLQEDRYDDSLHYFNQAIEFAESIDSNETLLQIHEAILQLHEATNDFEKQVFHLKQANLYRERINHTKALMKTRSLEFQFEIEKANQQKALLERKNVELETNQKELETHFKRLETLAELGQEITSTLDISDLLETIYKKITTLMKADMFTIGIFDNKQNVLNFPLVIENDERFPEVSCPIDDETRPAVICFKNKQEIVINNLQEYRELMQKVTGPLIGELPESIIYLPLISKKVCIGVISVQSFQAGAYTDYQMNMLRTLGSYVSIALENSLAYEKVHRIQKRLVEQNTDILDSLRYAQRIQNAIMPPESDFDKVFDDFFVLYRPKDIVSGDFYWCQRKGDRFLFAVVDCTGHGVPGAFMSIVGFNALNAAVNELNLTDPGKILDQLNKEVISTLHKNESEQSIRDGMDLTLCSLDLNTYELEIASAMNPYYLIDAEGITHKFKGDRYPIGSLFRKGYAGYETQKIQLEVGATLYISSDGFFDQFGDSENGRVEKFKHHRFRELIQTVSPLPMPEQRKEMLRHLKKWMGKNKQLDDICMIGVRRLK